MDSLEQLVRSVLYFLGFFHANVLNLITICLSKTFEEILTDKMSHPDHATDKSLVGASSKFSKVSC